MRTRKGGSARRRGAGGGRTAAPRAPRQARGQRRVEAILDAAAALIAERGIGSLTVHGVAKRAGTSIGSMYHFFPDLDAVIAGLAERHLRGLAPLLTALAGRPPREWARMSAAGTVDAIVTPIFDYLRRHPDVMPLNALPSGRGGGGGGGGSPFGEHAEEMKHVGLDIIERVLAARRPRLAPAEREARAAVILGTAEGVALMLARTPADPDRVVAELRRALGAYLEAAERRG